jgi:hypothetical protein
MADFVNDNAPLPDPKNEQTVPLGKEARFIRGQDYNALRDAAGSLRTNLLADRSAQATKHASLDTALANETSARAGGDAAERAYVNAMLGGIGAPEANAARITAQEVHTSGWVNVRSYGAKGDGVTDDTAAALAADATGKTVEIPDGTFLYTGATNPTFAGGVDRKAGATWRSTAVTDTLVFDADGTLVGLHQNHPQTNVGDSKPAPVVTSGVMVPPPVSKAAISGPVDVLAHWYNDHGLDATRSGGHSNWIGQYDWRWNFVGSANYDGARHPLLGFYRGDDPNVLDWQCYWLREHGINVIVPDELIDTAAWSSASNHGHWIWHLFNDVPNANGLRVVPWVKYTSSAPTLAERTTELATHWDAMINLRASSDRGYTVERDGAAYLVVFLWDEAALNGALDAYSGLTTNGQPFLQARAAAAKAAGYGGLLVLSRGTSVYFTKYTTIAGLDIANAAGFSMLKTRYGDMPGQSGVVGTYADLVDAYALPSASPEVANVLTSAKSHSSHTSTWDWPGSTPALFEEVLKKAIRQTVSTHQPRIVTVYNIAEWQEAGPGLQPNRQDGFGYLRAMRNALNDTRALVSDPIDAVRQYVDSAQVVARRGAKTIRVYSTFSLTLTGAAQLPTIAPGYDGQRIRVMNDPAVGSYDIILDDNGTTSGTALYLTSPKTVLRPWEWVDLEYSVSKSGWVQTGGVNGLRRTYSGTGAPSASLGRDGDWYQRSDTPGTANQRLYIKSAGAWTGIL